MSEPIPESVPTSVSHRSHRPTKKRALTPSNQQTAQVEALFANPDRADNVIAIGPRVKVLQAPPEIVANVQGSSAGAGSGEFHVYKASRRRENERLRAMDDELKAEEAEKDFQQRKEERERKDQEKLNKNRAKRGKAKARQQKKKQGSSGVVDTDPENENEVVTAVDVKRKLGPAKTSLPTRADVSESLSHSSSAANQSLDEGAGITIHDDD